MSGFTCPPGVSPAGLSLHGRAELITVAQAVETTDYGRETPRPTSSWRPSSREQDMKTSLTFLATILSSQLMPITISQSSGSGRPWVGPSLLSPPSLLSAPDLEFLSPEGCGSRRSPLESCTSQRVLRRPHERDGLEAPWDLSG